MLAISRNDMHKQQYNAYIVEREFAAYYYAEPKCWLGLLSVHFRLFNLKVLHDGDVIPEMNPLPLASPRLAHLNIALASAMCQ